MNPTSGIEDLEKHSSNLGFWSSLLTGVLNFLYFVPFVLYQPILHAEWRGLGSYASSFKPLPFVAWVVPCMFLPLAFLVMIVCLYYQTKGPKRIFGLLALTFAVMYAAVLAPNYYIQLTMVQHNLVNGNLEGLTLWLYAFPYPHSIPGALEGIGFGFMCVSFIFAAMVFGKGKLDRWLFWIFLGNGICGSVVFTDPIAPLPNTIVMIDLVIEGLLLAVAPFLMAAFFRRRAVFEPDGVVP
jgi:hypothetical protein